MPPGHTLAVPTHCVVQMQVCNYELLSEVESVADELVASGKPIRWVEGGDVMVLTHSGILIERH